MTIQPTLELQFPLEDRMLRLRTQGNGLLLRKHGRVAVIGSRKAANRSREVCELIAAGLAGKDITVVSGGAGGIDQVGHRAALEAGGSTVIVLAQGLDTWIPPVCLAEVWDWDRILLVSQFSDHTPWHAGGAYQRNITIAQLSDAVIPVAAENNSGSENMINESRRMKKPLFVPVYREGYMPAGNLDALRKGASPLYNTVNGPDLRRLLSVVLYSAAAKAVS